MWQQNRQHLYTKWATLLKTLLSPALKERWYLFMFLRVLLLRMLFTSQPLIDEWWSITDQQPITHEDERVTGLEIHWPAAAASRSASRTDTSTMLRCWPPSWHLHHITTHHNMMTRGTHKRHAHAHARLFLRDARGGSNNCDWLILPNDEKSNICHGTLARANNLLPK